MRILVIGTSGAGKTTLARRLAHQAGFPHVELDAVNWQPGWRDLDRHDPPEFARRVSAVIQAERWVADGNYGSVRDLLWRRATHLVWLDYSRPVIMARVHPALSPPSGIPDRIVAWHWQSGTVEPLVPAKSSDPMGLEHVGTAAARDGGAIEATRLCAFGGVPACPSKRCEASDHRTDRDGCVRRMMPVQCISARRASRKSRNTATRLEFRSSSG